MNTIKRLLSIVTLGSIVLLMFSCAAKGPAPGGPENQGVGITADELDSEIKAAGGFYKAAENAAFALYVHGSTAEIAVEDKANDTMWYSNPQERETDPFASPDELAKLGSQLQIEYIDDTNRTLYMNTKNDSLSYGQYEFARIEQGVRVTYTLGEKAVMFCVPLVIEKTRFEALLAKMSAEDRDYVETRYSLVTLEGATAETREQLLKTYPSLDEHDVYALPNMGMADFIMERLDGIFTSAGYTLEELAQDHADNQVASEPQPISFTISVEYTLEDDGLVLRIPSNGIVEDDRVHLTRIEPLMFFGASGTTEKGYMLIPDGSGALIELNNGKTDYSAYSAPVYGLDHAVSLEEKPVDTAHCYLPVYGMKRGQSAFLTIIEKGDAMAEINADVSGRFHSYNTVYASFSYYSASRQSLPYGDYEDIYMFSPTAATEDIQLRYTFLYGDNADYSGMARTYREYLLDREALPQNSFSEAIPFDLSVLGAVDYHTSFLLLPVTRLKALTSYEQAEDILEKLKDSGISNIHLQYLSWANNGFYNRANNRVELISELGGKKAFSRLLEYAEENGVAIYPDVDFLYVGKDTLDFSAGRDAANQLNGERAYRYDYDLSTGKALEDRKKFILKPSALTDYISDFIRKYTEYGNPALSISTLGTDLNTDYDKDGGMNRAQSMQQITAGLAKLAEDNIRIATEGANAYTLKYLAHIFDMPEKSAGHYMLDYSIPFYQMVVHGYISYSCPAMNLAGNWQDSLLKSLETGASPSFLWMYAQNYELKETDYDFYSTHYLDWIERAVKAYQEINEVLAPLQGETLVSHTICAKGLIRTQYSDGTRIYINYNADSVTCDGITITAKGYKVVKA